MDLRREMRQFWASCVIACLLCELLGGFVLAQQASLDWEEELGVDMCPECRPLPPPVPTRRSSDLHEKDRSLECQPSTPLVPTVTPYTSHEEDLGVDMCPECRPLAPPVPTVTPCTSHEEDLGVDMCPECQPLAPLVPTETLYSLHEEDLGVDMCPEKGQPMSVSENLPVRLQAIDSNSLVKELQQLVKVQQLQIDQLADLLQHLGRTHPSVNLEVMDLPKEQMPTSIESSLVTDDEVSEQQVEDEQSPDLTKIREQQKLLHTMVDQKSVQVENGVVPTHVENLGSGTRGMTVARYRPAWSEHFSFLSAVKVDGEVSCLHVLPQEGDDGVSRYVVVGDMTGRLYIFLWLGDLLLDYPTISVAPITSMLSYTLQKNETILVTGHSDGGVLVHQIWETVEHGSFSSDSSTTLSSIEILHSLVPPSPRSLRVRLEDRKVVDQGIKLPTNNMDDLQSGKEETMSIANLEMYKVGKMRYTLVGDMSGKIRLFRDNGSLHGIAKSPRRPLTFMRSPSAQRLVFLTEVGVGSLDLRSMQVRINLCEGLNSSTVMAYAFDVAGRTKAHGFTAEGDLVSVALTGDMLHFECHVKKKRKVEIVGHIAPQALKGYLVAATLDHVLVFNTTLQTGFSSANFWLAGPTPLFSVTMNEIALSFLATPIKRSHWPVMASNRDKLVVVGFGDGYVGVFRSNLPTAKPADFSVKFWNSSVLICALVLLVIWQLFNRKREPGTVMSSENPVVVPSGTSAYGKEERLRLSFGQTEKVAEPRSFRSPTRGYVDTNPTTFGSARRFGSSAVDTGSYSARREPLFSSTQPVGELERLQ